MSEAQTYFDPFLGHNVFVPGLGKRWRNSDGSLSRVEVAVFNDDWDAARLLLEQKAKDMGWPGHEGKWWQYARDDLVRFFNKIDPFA